MEELWAKRGKALCFVAVLGFVFAANYTNHGPLVSTLIKQLEITFAMAGFLTTAIFLSHGIMAIPGGALADRFSPKKTISFALGIIAAGNILIGLTNSYYVILLLKFIIGTGTGTCAIAGARYVIAFFLGKEIQRAQGIYGGSILCGSGFVIYGIPQLLPLVGWHNIFIITGGMAGVLLVLWFFFAPDTPQAAITPKIVWSGVLANRNIWLLSMAHLASFGEIITCSVWVNTLLIKSIHLQPKTAGIIGSAVLLMGILSRPLGGFILDHGIVTTRTLLVTACAGLGVGFIWMGLSSSMGMVIPAIILCGVMAGLPYAGVFNGARDNYPDCPGVAMGFVIFWGSFGIMALPPMIGCLLDVTGTFVGGFFVLGALALAVSLALLALKSPKPDVLKEKEPLTCQAI
jgi:nitrate/nitrite transporter NarK